jgi:hypothetical protein
MKKICWTPWRELRCGRKVRFPTARLTLRLKLNLLNYKTYPDVPRPGAPDVPLYGDHNALYGAYMERLPSENLLSEMIPANVRAGYSYGRGPITQRFFPERDLNYLRDVYERERQNYMAVTPMDQGFVRGPVPEQKFVPYEEYSRQRAVPTVQSVPGAMNALYSYFDPAYRLAPFTQGAYYEEGPGGMYMHNTYNAGGVPREVNVLLPRRSQR